MRRKKNSAKITMRQKDCDRRAPNKVQTEVPAERSQEHRFKKLRLTRFPPPPGSPGQQGMEGGRRVHFLENDLWNSWDTIVQVGGHTVSLAGVKLAAEHVQLLRRCSAKGRTCSYSSVGFRSDAQTAPRGPNRTRRLTRFHSSIG